MQETIVNKILNQTLYKKVMIGLSLIIILSIAATCGMLYVMLKSDKIIKGTYINNINVSSLTKENAKKLVEEQCVKLNDSLKVTIKNGSDLNSYTFKETGIKPDISKAVDEAFSIGRSGNTFSNILTHFKTAYKTNNISLKLDLSNKDFRNFIENLDSKLSIKPTEASLSNDGQNLMLLAGSNGKNIDRDKFLDLFNENINSLSSFEVKVPFKDILPKSLNVDEIYSSIKVEPQNARIDVAGNNLTYVDAVVGRDIDKNELSSIVNDINNKKVPSKILPIKYTSPEITLNSIKGNILKDTLATASTQFYRGDQNNDNRAANIALAVKKINGKMLAPGEIFSFNNTVGARTETEGYKIAKAYSNGQIIDDIGGGICQVSTTLFNAVLYSDMGIVERTNHMFTVGYIDKGQDAAVAYDYVDMKFKNTSNLPIKILGEVTPDNRVVFSIVGTNTNPNKKIEIQNNLISTLDFNTKYIDDPNMENGTSYVKTNGMTGYIIDTFKIVKENGKIVNNEKLYTSTYDSLSKEVIRGTKGQ